MNMINHNSVMIFEKKFGKNMRLVQRKDPELLLSGRYGYPYGRPGWSERVGINDW